MPLYTPQTAPDWASITGKPTTVDGFGITDVGDWVAPTFNAANFTATGGTTPTWVVDSADVVGYKYTIIGKTVLFNGGTFQQTTVTGLPNFLRLQLPFTSLTTSRFMYQYINNSAPIKTGFALIQASNIVSFGTDGLGEVWANATNTTSLYVPFFAIEIA